MSYSHDLLEHFEALASRFDIQRRKQRYYFSELRRWLRYVVPEGGRVLELGCGDGTELMALKPSQAMGIDFSHGLIQLARARHPEGQWLVHDVSETLPPIAQTFDYILAIDLVGYLQDFQGAMEQVRRICGEDTRLVFTKMNPFWGPFFRLGSWFGLVEPRRYSNWLSQRQCHQILELAGFEVIHEDKFCLLPFYIPIVSWFCNQVLAHLPFFNRLALVEYFICRRAADRSQVTADRSQPSVSVVIPTRNEKGNLRVALERMPRFPGSLEVIFVEGHSQDGTWEEIQKLSQENWPFSVKAYQQTGRGKGDAVRLGFEKATQDLLMILDADLTVMPEELPRFYRLLADRRAEYVQGTRLVYPMEGEAMRPLNWIGNKIFSATLTFLLKQELSDTLCGTKCLWREAYKKLVRQRVYFGDFDPFGDFDLIFGASKLSLKMAEIPVHYKSRTYGETQIRRFRDGLLLLRMCWFAARKMYFL